MKQTTCIYCKEEIREDAIRCRHCYSDLVTTFEQQATAVILGRHYIFHEPSLIKPSGSACDALCYHKFGSDKVRLN